MAGIEKINDINAFFHERIAKTQDRSLDGNSSSRFEKIPQDKVSLSKQGRQAQRSRQGAIKDKSELTSEEQQKVNELKQRDAEVKAHEQAHMAAGGGVVQGGASYQYEMGPDGKQYAVGGEVKIDVSPGRTPEATIRKMQQVRRAALAPAQPSGTDRAVAARAAQAEAQARMEKSEKEQAEQKGESQASIEEPKDQLRIDQQSAQNGKSQASPEALKDQLNIDQQSVQSPKNALEISFKPDALKNPLGQTGRSINLKV